MILDLWDDLGCLSDGDPEDWACVSVVPTVLVVTVLVSLSSVVTAILEGVSMQSDWEFFEPQSSSSSRERSFVWADSQEEMSYEGSPVKALPASRRRMIPPKPQQSSHSSIEDMQWQTEMEVQGSSWNAGESTVTARLEQ